MSAKVLEVHLIGDGVSLDRALSGSAKTAVAAASTMEAAGARITKTGTKITSAGKAWTHGISLPLAAIGVASVKMAADFGRSMGEIATQAGGSEKEVKKFTAQIREAASHGRFAQSNNEIAKSLYNIESGGYRAAKAWKIEKSAADFAAVGHADLESTTSALVGVMKTGVKGAQDSQKAIGALNAIIGAGKMHMEDLNAAIGTGFLGSAKAFSVSIYGAGAALAELTAQGVPAASAATRLRMVISLMGAPTSKAVGMLEEIGINSEDLAKKMQSSGGVITALELLHSKMQGMTKIEQTQLLAGAFGGAKSGGTILQLIGSLNDLNEKQKQILANSGNINEAIKRTNAEPAVKMEKAWRQIENTLEELGETLLPVAAESFTSIAHTIASISGSFHNLDKGTQGWILKIGAAFLVGGPLLMGIGKLVTGWGKLVTLIGKAGVALGIFEATQATGSVVGAAGGIASGVGGAGAGGAAARWIGAPVVAQTERGAVTSALAAQGGIFSGIAGGAGAGMLGGIFKSSGGIKGAAQVLGRSILGIAGGYVVDELALKGMGALGVKDPTEGQGIFGSLTHGFNTSKLKGKRSEAESSELVGANLFSVKPKLSAPDAIKIQAQYQGLMRKLSSDSILGLKTINYDLHRGLQTASTLWATNTPQWRIHAVAAMQGAVKSIKSGMKAGTIPVKEGKKEINQLLQEIHLTKGSDPFGLAKETVKSFQETKGITAKGVKQWTQELELMPKGAREATQNTTLQMLRQWAQGHPKIEAQVQQLTSHMLNKFGATNKQLAAGVKHGATGPIADAFKGLAGGVAGSLQNIGVNTQQVLKALGVKNIPQFQIVLATGGEGGKFTAPGSAEVGTSHRQEGGPVGFIVPGTGSGDKFETSVPPRSFVLNREATDFFGFQSGGHVPVKLEPKERVFMPHEVDRIGLNTLVAMNSMVQRFQEGGLAIPHPHLIGGTDPLRQGGQHVIDQGYHAATKYISKHAEPPRILRALHAMEEQAAKGYPYVFGGGHSGFHGPFDCSGYVSYGLHAAGFINAPLAVQQGSGLYTLGAPGPGKYLTWGVTGTSGMNAHTMMSIKKPGSQGWGYFEAGGSGGGAHEDQGWDGSFQFRHMPGFQQGGQVGVPVPAQEAIAKYGQAAFDPKSRHFVGWGYQSGGTVVTTGGEVMIRNGMDPVAAAGALGNAYGESAWNPSAMEPGTHNGGLFGFTASPVSLSDEEAYAKSQGKPWDDVATQVQFMLHHLDSGIKGKMNAAGSTDETTSIFMHEWERPENYSSLGVRQSAAAKALKMLGGKGGAGGGGGGGKTESIPGVFHGVRTKAISFPSMPKTMAGINRELYKRKKELGQYKSAVKAASGKPQLEHALQANVTALETRIREVRKERLKLKQEIVRKRFKKRLAKKLGKVTGYETKINADERDLERAEQFAQQVVDLEPQKANQEDEQTFEAKFNKYIESEERPAYQHVLNLAGELRNTILGAELFGFGKGSPSADDMEHIWEGNVRKLSSEIEATESFNKKVSERIDDWRKTHGNTKFPEWLKKEIGERDKRIGQIPVEKFKKHEFEQTIGSAREAFFSGGDKRLKPPVPPLPGTGSFEDALVNLQGTHWPAQHEKIWPLPVAPVPGHFGGQIWNTQMAIRELGLKIAEAGGGSGSGEGNSEKLALVEEQREQERRRTVSLEANLSAMASGIGTIGPKGLKATYPWAGRYAKGGTVAALFGEEGPEIGLVPEGTNVRTASDTESLLQPRVEVNNHHYHDHTDTEVFINGKQQMDAIVNHVSEQLGNNANHRAQTVSDGRTGTL